MWIQNSVKGGSALCAETQQMAEAVCRWQTSCQQVAWRQQHQWCAYVGWFQGNLAERREDASMYPVYTRSRWRVLILDWPITDQLTATWPESRDVRLSAPRVVGKRGEDFSHWVRGRGFGNQLLPPGSSQQDNMYRLWPEPHHHTVKVSKQPLRFNSTH